jgi:hypothetical protein
MEQNHNKIKLVGKKFYPTMTEQEIFKALCICVPQLHIGSQYTGNAVSNFQ